VLKKNSQKDGSFLCVVVTESNKGEDLWVSPKSKVFSTYQIASGSSFWQ